MKIIYVLTAAATLFSAALFSQCASQANIYSFTYAGRNYDVVKEVKNWTNASACAVSRGGYLVHIDSLAEQTAVYNAITVGAGVSSTYASVQDGGGIAYVWIGATDRQTEGTWLWDGDYNNSGPNFWTGQGTAGAGTGAAVNSSYVNWGGTSTGPAQEPDDYLGIQDCGAIGLNTWPHGMAGEWNDISGLNNLYYVIEYDSTVSGINNHEQKFQSQFYPNPASDFLNIVSTNSNQQINGLKIYNQLGSLVYDQAEINPNDISVNVSEFAEGIYFVALTFADGEIENQKISVVR
jgi:hypothetical protein